MASASAITTADRANPGRLGVLRLAATGSLSAAIFFLLCWTGAVLGLGPLSHMYVALFTSAAVTSGLALLEGLCWSLVFGLVAGALIAAVYNALAALDRR
jgi:hypothetical protein